VPYQPFKTSDGDVILACGNDNLFNKFCEVAGCRDLPADPRFCTNSKRVENRNELGARLVSIFAQRTTRDWCDALEAAGVPNGPINNLKQVFEEPQVVARGMKFELEHAIAGMLPLIASPMKFSGTKLEFNLPPPLLGQHTDEVLRKVLKLNDAAIAKLRADGIV
jgi:crotonobetainyl-CoA:carnitine CoA-transferase CaiB-like acyl-CoA transferase